MLRLVILFLFIAVNSCTTTPPATQSPTMYAGLGDMYAQANHFAEAENYYAKAHILEPNKVDISFKLADTQIQQDKFDRATETYQQVLSANPENHKARYRLARVQMLRGELVAALSQYQLLLKVNKQDPQALNGLGVLLDNLSQFSFAKSCYQHGLMHAAKDYALLNNLGVSYALSGNLVQAKLLLDQSGNQAVTSRPKDNLILINHYFAKIKDPTERQHLLKKSLLLKNVSSTQDLVNHAIFAAKQWCA